MSDVTSTMTVTRSSHRSADRSRRVGFPHRTTRALVVAAMIVLDVALVVWNHDVREWESVLFAPLAGLATGHRSVGTPDGILFVGLRTPGAFGLQITDECTTAVLLVPVVGILALFTAFSTIPLRRVATAMLVATGALVAVNAVRVAIIAFATWHWGVDPGFELSHVFVGSAFAIVGFAGALLLAVRTLTRGRSGEGDAAPARHRS